MKTLFLSLTLFIFFSCKRTEHKISVSDNSTDTLEVDEYKRDSIYNPLFERDSIIIIVPENNDTTILSKKELIFLEKNYPCLFSGEYVSDPDIVFNQRKLVKQDSLFNNFNSEVGQDNFYVLYAYFLSIENGQKNHQTERNKIIDIYENINSIYAKLNGGGTYYGHMSSRIIGYAEYAIYTHSFEEPEINRSKQKELFIQSLKQNVADELREKNDLSIDYKQKLNNDIQALINKLDKELDSYFYLTIARRFNYSKYNN